MIYDTGNRSDGVFPFGRFAYYLDIYAFDIVASESFLSKPGLDDFHQVVINYILIQMIINVIEMDMVKIVDVEIHFVVCAQPIFVYPEH